MAEKWEFEEALECFKVIDSSLRCIYRGEHHMYRALSGQLRILLCDKKPLLLRLCANLALASLAEVRDHAPGSFPSELAHLNALSFVGVDSFTIACMPFEVSIYFNGVEDCKALLHRDRKLLPLEEWTSQIVLLDPVPVTIRQLIRTVADRGGGAHVHHSKDALLRALRKGMPSRMTQDALVIVALAKVMQGVGLQFIQLYERFGHTASLPLEDFDLNHVSVLDAARVPKECFQHAKQAFNLLCVRAV
ncbi:hypothetical protein J2W35_004860 [Variovorax boronicumulans]|uniref:hypothetical protein n=1 Tax=Variovorax boronicumulans TaxID=436515 RepID=UPI002780C9A9|nr:hypothetical protein [Variovorax boronicumulans]MDQ0084491.1 hypothetical protein [Variovorax boronicumulans]